MSEFGFWMFVLACVVMWNAGPELIAMINRIAAAPGVCP